MIFPFFLSLKIIPEEKGLIRLIFFHFKEIVKGNEPASLRVEIESEKLIGGMGTTAYIG